MNSVATIQPSRLPIPPAVAREFDVSSAQWRVLVEQIFPNAKTVEAVTMALSYCRARNLDIYKKPVHVVPMWSSSLNKMVETVWPGIAEIRTTATRTGEYAGIDAVEFGPMVERTFYGEKDVWERKQKTGVEKFSKTVRYPEWASVVVYRWVKGQKAAFHTRIFWEETYATIGKTEVPNDMWAKRTRGQLDKCVEAAALRKAFPEELGSMYAAEEMEGRVIDHDVGEKAEPTPPKPPAPPATTQPPADTSHGNEHHATCDFVDAETGEIVDGRNFVQETGEDAGSVECNGEVIDDNTFFERLEEALACVTDAASLEEVWSEFGPMERFENQPNGETNQKIARAIKARAEKRVGGGDGKK